MPETREGCPGCRQSCVSCHLGSGRPDGDGQCVQHSFEAKETSASCFPRRLASCHVPCGPRTRLSLGRVQGGGRGSSAARQGQDAAAVRARSPSTGAAPSREIRGYSWSVLLVLSPCGHPVPRAQRGVTIHPASDMGGWFFSVLTVPVNKATDLQTRNPRPSEVARVPIFRTEWQGLQPRSARPLCCPGLGLDGGVCVWGCAPPSRRLPFVPSGEKSRGTCLFLVSTSRH